MTDSTTALLLQPDGAVHKIIMPAHDHLHAMYAAIGCQRVDCLSLTSHLDLWFDDEYLYSQDQPNLAARYLARMYTGTPHPIQGPAIVASVNTAGDTISHTPDRIAAVVSHLTN